MNHIKFFRTTIFLFVGLCHISSAFVIKGHPTPTMVKLSAASDSTSVDADEIIARRIVVTGDVQGGYYRSCVRNEVRL
jgi:hypothetical protein